MKCPRCLVSGKQKGQVASEKEPEEEACGLVRAWSWTDVVCCGVTHVMCEGTSPTHLTHMPQLLLALRPPFR